MERLLKPIAVGRSHARRGWLADLWTHLPRHRNTSGCRRWAYCGLATLLSSTLALATPDFVQHDPGTGVYGEPADVTMREPNAPREGETITIWAQIGYSFFWTDAAVYYTTDGTDPQGSFGTASNGTAIAMSFVRNEPNSPNNIDWVNAQIPSQAYDTVVKYKIGVWDSGGGIEVFANNTGCADNTCDDPGTPQEVFTYAVLLPWPGMGYGSGTPDIGFPNIHFWKEEAVVGNNYTNIMIDQNGTMYDMYFPSAGCVQGVSTKNEGYVNGNDTFPPGLPLGFRGQMHLNQAQAGLRIDGVTYWISNEAGAYTNHSQAYVTDNNVVQSSSTLSINGYNIQVDQYDFAPKGITFPNDSGSNPVRAIHIKRYLLTNNGGSARTIDFYYNADFALNGGDSYDAMFADSLRGAMVAYDNTNRFTSVSGEYNPTSFGDYEKDVSVYLGASLKACDSVGSATGSVATDSWRDSSPDNQTGWVASRITLNPGETKELNVATVGGFDDFAGATGTYNYFIAPAFDWFHTTSMATIQQGTETYWTNWLASGVDIDFPDPGYESLFRRSLLATALHVDAANGGVIAGMHNGAYPFVWPRDALYAAVTLARAGHQSEAAEVFRFLRDVAYRDNDTWGKGFWYQKYTTDGYTVWSAPQVDETSNVTWAAYYYYLSTGDLSFLDNYYTMFYEAGRAMSEDSSISSNLRYEEAVDLMYSNNVWEDAFDTFIYSNATVIRGLEDASRIADTLDQQVCPGGPGTCNYHNDKALFDSRATAIRGGLDARLAWNGENTDISQLGIVWPFEVYPAGHPRAELVMDRINGVATDTFGNNHPLVNFSGEWQDLINRYWNDTYWWHPTNPNPNGSPWFLSTMWYGQYYCQRQDITPGKSDVDNFKFRIDRSADFLGPIGLGAEQMAPENSLLYPGETDFKLQTAWPNAWESMSFFVDCIMMFLDHKPDAPNDRIYLEPKLPTGWSTITYENVKVTDTKAVDVACSEGQTTHSQTFTNLTGGTVNYDTWIRLPQVAVVTSVTQDGSPIAYTLDSTASRVNATGTINSGVGSNTVVAVTFNDVRGDFDHNGTVDAVDIQHFVDCTTGPAIPQNDPMCADAKIDADGDVDSDDWGLMMRCVSIGNPGGLADPSCEN